MKITVVESTTGIKRQFQGNENMSVLFLIQKLSENFGYDKRRLKLLYKTIILNKTPDMRQVAPVFLTEYHFTALRRMVSSQAIRSMS